MSSTCGAMASFLNPRSDSRPSSDSQGVCFTTRLILIRTVREPSGSTPNADTVHVDAVLAEWTLVAITTTRQALPRRDNDPKRSALVGTQQILYSSRNRLLCDTST